MIEISPVKSLALFQSNTVVPLRLFTPGQYYQKMNVGGNAIYSTLTVISAEPGTTVDVRYFHFGAGNFNEEIIAKARHTVITSAALALAGGEISDEVLVTRIHNKPYFVVTVTGGNAELMMYTTINSSFASDADSSLKLDGEPSNLEVDKALIIGSLDVTDNTYRFLKSRAGSLFVTSSPSVDIQGVRKYDLSGTVPTTPGALQQLIMSEVPVGKKWDIVRIDVITGSTGRWSLQDDGELFASGQTGPTIPKSDFTWPYSYRMESGAELVLDFDVPADRPTNEVDFYVQMIESDL